MTDAATIAVLVIVALSILLMLTRPRGIAEVWWVGSGALLLVVCRLMPFHSALAAVAKGVDVYFFLTGMMLLSELARAHGVFDWLSSLALRSAGRSRSRLFGMVYAAGTLVTIFMSNDATAVVLTPAILTVVRKARVEPLPYLFVCAMVANAASFVLPISNPANLVVYQGDLPSLGKWLFAFGLPSVVSIACTYVVLRFTFRRELGGEIQGDVERAVLSRFGAWVVLGLLVVSVVLLVASACSLALGPPTFVAAVVLTGAVSIADRKNPVALLREVSWSTLLLVAALFVMVEASVGVGALDVTRAWFAYASSLSNTVGALVVGFAVGIANNVVNNLPLGLIVGSTLRAAHPSPAVQHAVLIGVDVGPNLAISGSLATILWLLAVRKEKLDVGFWQFFKVGARVMPVALAAAILASLLTSSGSRSSRLHERRVNNETQVEDIAILRPVAFSNQGLVGRRR